MFRFPIFLMLMALIMPAQGQTLAQTESELRRWVTNEGRRDRCVTNGVTLVHAAPMLLEPRAVFVALVSQEGCGGGNNWGSNLQVYVRQGQGFRALPMTMGRSHPDVAERIRMLDGNTILVEGLGYGPDDGRCCPTQRRRAAYTVMDGRVSPMPLPPR